MASTFIRKERCEECGRKFTPKRDCFKNVTKDEIGLYFCSKKCDIKFFKRNKKISELYKKLFKKHKKLFKKTSPIEDFGFSEAAFLFINEHNLEDKFDAWTNSDDYVKALKKEVKMFGKYKDIE